MFYHKNGYVEGKRDLAYQIIADNQTEKLKFCLQSGVFSPGFLIENENILGRILKSRRPDCLEVLLSFDDVDVMNIGVNDAAYRDDFSMNSLSYILQSGDEEELWDKGTRLALFQRLLKDPRVEVNIENGNSKERPIHLAAALANPWYLQALLKHPEIEINALDLAGQSPLSIALSKRNLRNVQALAASKDFKFFSLIHDNQLIIFISQVIFAYTIIVFYISKYY